MTQQVRTVGVINENVWCRQFFGQPIPGSLNTRHWASSDSVATLKRPRDQMLQTRFLSHRRTPVAVEAVDKMRVFVWSLSVFYPP